MLKIERLVLEDFKSFAGHTEIDLEPGVSVVVGPNGSGKSNLLDALRWVFGEADLSTLRADTPEDLIFRGSGNRSAPTSFRVTAQVIGTTAGQTTATRGFDRREGEFFQLDSAPVGEGEYLSGLRGLGVPAPLFTTIRQGDVGRLLWYHPEERAKLFQDLVSRPMPGGSTHSAVARERARLLLTLASDPTDPLLIRLLDSLGLPAPSELPTPAHVPDSVTSQVGTVEKLLAKAGEGTARDTDNGATGIGDTSDGYGRGGNGAGGTGVRGADAHAPASQFEGLRRRIEDRMQRFFGTLVPGGETALPPIESDATAGLPAVGVGVRFPGKPAVGLEALSGGQQAILGLSLALAVFLERPSPALVLDEVEPALDDALVRRVSRLLDHIGRERQVIAVSHQRIMRHSARHVMHVERKNNSSRIGLRYDPRTFRGPGAPRR